MGRVFVRVSRHVLVYELVCWIKLVGDVVSFCVYSYVSAGVICEFMYSLQYLTLILCEGLKTCVGAN